MALDPKALDALEHNQRQLDQDGVEVGVSRQALDELISAYKRATGSEIERPDPLTVVAEALECFWNASIGSARNSQDATALAIAGALSEGFAAIATRLKEKA